MPDGLNVCHFIGNLGRDPEMRYTANGKATTSFSIAVSRSSMSNGERKEQTEWVPVVTWEKLAEVCGENLHKGRKVYVEGRLATRSWDGPDGLTRYRTEIIANKVLFLDKGKSAPEPLYEGDVGGDIDPDQLPFD